MNTKYPMGLIRQEPYKYTDPDPIQPSQEQSVQPSGNNKSLDPEKQNLVLPNQKDYVFIIHGHDQLPVYQVGTFLKNGNLEVIVLKDEPGRGQAIIEKIESYSKVDFVVALLTPDDKGGTVATPSRRLNLRARQNVIFELGYFSGKLGRHKVCALASRKIELPSDFAGVEWIAYGESGWEWKLARELEAAHLRFDIASALSRSCHVN